MPTDAELRRLFHEAPSPRAAIDPDAIIRRSKRRRLPQQLGAGSAVTLAVAGIGVASITGLQTLSPTGTAETAVDSPMGAAEEGPFSGPEAGVAPARLPLCDVGSIMDAAQGAGLAVVPRFPDHAAPGEPVTGTLSLTNSGAEEVQGTVFAPIISLSRDGMQVWHPGEPAETPVALAPGETLTLDFHFAAIDCNRPGEDNTLEPGEYEITALLTLAPDNGPVRTIGGPASVITIR